MRRVLPILLMVCLLLTQVWSVTQALSMGGEGMPAHQGDRVVMSADCCNAGPGPSAEACGAGGCSVHCVGLGVVASVIAMSIRTGTTVRVPRVGPVMLSAPVVREKRPPRRRV